MIDAGEVVSADIGAETRTDVLVVSNRRFHRLAERAIVCPKMAVVPNQRFPWWIETEHGVFAVDRIATLPLDRLLQSLGCISPDELAQLRAALRAIA